MNEYKIIAEVIENGNQFTSTFYVYGENTKDAIMKFKSQHNVVPWKWEIFKV